MGGRVGKVLIGPGRPYDLIAICLLVAVAVLLSFYQLYGPLTWTLGFLAVFFAPGYAIVSTLFPGQKALLSNSYIMKREERLIDVGLLERFALSFGLGAAVMALSGTLLTRGILDLNSLTVGLEAAIFTYGFSAAAIYRRSKLPMGDQFAVTTKSRLMKQQLTVAEKGVTVIIVAALIVLCGVTINGLNAHPSPEPFSEFYITGGDGIMEHLPQTLAATQSGFVKVTITSHLGTNGHFILVLALENSTIGSASFDPGSNVLVRPNSPRSMTLDLADGQTWEKVITFLVPSPGERTLYLILDDGREEKTLWMPLTIT